MVLTAQIVREERRTRWFRRVAPFVVLLGILVLLMIPGVLVEEHPEPDLERVAPQPLVELALPRR